MQLAPITNKAGNRVLFTAVFRRGAVNGTT
jgi:hypothetical protein